MPVCMIGWTKHCRRQVAPRQHDVTILCRAIA
jgi:hypothetical protein